MPTSSRASPSLESKLFLAARSHGASQVQKLLALGANPLATNANGETPLIVAAAAASRYAPGSSEAAARIAVVEVLAPVSNVDAISGDGQSAMRRACLGDRPQLVNILLGAGAVPDARAAKTDWTPLMIAASAGSEACVRILLAAGADPKITARSGFTALMAAAKYQPSIVDILIPVSDAQAKGAMGRDALMIAAYYGSEECVRKLLWVCDSQATDERGLGAADYAAKRGGRAGLVRLIRQEGPIHSERLALLDATAGASAPVAKTRLSL